MHPLVRLGTLRPSIVAFALLAFCPFVSAISVVTWGPSTGLVTANQNSQRGVGALALDLVTPMTPGSANYTGAPVYGGVQLSGTVSLTAHRLSNNHAVAAEGYDMYDLRNTDATPTTGLMTALFLWDNPYLSAPLPGGTLKNLVRLKEFSYTGGYTPTSLATAYFVIRYDKGSGSYGYMISPAGINGFRLATNGGTHTLDAETAAWYDYDPTTGAGLANINTTTAISDPSLILEGVTHVGLLFQMNSKDADCSLTFYRFSVTAENWRKKAPFKALYNNDTGNVEIFDLRRPGYTGTDYDKDKFGADKLRLSIDEARDVAGGTNNGVDAYMISPGYSHVPLWQSGEIDPDDHFTWYRYAHPMTGAKKLSAMGYYMDPSDTVANDGGDVVEVVVDHCATRGIASFVSFRVNDYHRGQDVDARPGLWNILTLTDLTNSLWRFENPSYRLGRAALSTRPEYRTWDTNPGTDDHELHTPGTWNDDLFTDVMGEANDANCLNWEIEAVRNRTFDLIVDVVTRNPGLSGLELDFPRAGNYFPTVPSPGDISSTERTIRSAHMVAFVRDVRHLLDLQGRRLNRNYWLSVRLPNIRQEVYGNDAGNDQNSIDVRSLAAEGVDMFVFCSRSTTHMVPVGTRLNLDPDLGEIGAAVRAINPQVALYYELTYLAGSRGAYDSSGGLAASIRWAAGREQLQTAMHLAYNGSGTIPGSGTPGKPWPVGIDGVSLYNYAYYRLAYAPDSTTTKSEPPFDIIPALKSPTAAAAASQHYTRGNLTINPANSSRTFTLVLRKPSTNSGQWTAEGRLRLRSLLPIDSGAVFVAKIKKASGDATLMSMPYTVPYPQRDGNGNPVLDSGGNPLPQFRVHEPTAQILEWKVLTSDLVEGVNTFEITNTGSGAPYFVYADLSISAP